MKDLYDICVNSALGLMFHALISSHEWIVFLINKSFTVDIFYLWIYLWRVNVSRVTDIGVSMPSEGIIIFSLKTDNKVIFCCIIDYLMIHTLKNSIGCLYLM
jgi:hypothetical protein